MVSPAARQTDYTHTSQAFQKLHYLRLRVQFGITQTLMLLAETDNAGWLIHIPRNVPNVEILRRVHHKELTESIHESSASLQCFFTFTASTIIVDCAPIDLYNGQGGRVAPHSYRRSVRIVVYAK